MAGYHLREIKKGIYGEFSKVREELEELEEALEQGNKIMALVEASDLIGALEAWAVKNGATLDDLIKMKDATNRAFEDGTRKAAEAEIELVKRKTPVLTDTPPLRKPAEELDALRRVMDELFERKDKKRNEGSWEYAPVPRAPKAFTLYDEVIGDGEEYDTSTSDA